MPFVNFTAVLAEATEEAVQRASGGIVFIDDLLALSRAQLRGLALLAAWAERGGVRVISFASEDPARLVDMGSLEAGVVPRLEEVIVPLPPLRRHQEDIPDIAAAMLAHMVEARITPDRRLSTPALNVLRNFSWPRNLEQLQRVVRSAALGAATDEISMTDVDQVLATFGPSANAGEFNFDQPIREARDQFERAYFEYLIEREGGSMSRVAEKSGVERTHLYRKLKQLGVATGKSRDDKD